MGSGAADPIMRWQRPCNASADAGRQGRPRGGARGREEALTDPSHPHRTDWRRAAAPPTPSCAGSALVTHLQRCSPKVMVSGLVLGHRGEGELTNDPLGGRRHWCVLACAAGRLRGHGQQPRLARLVPPARRHLPSLPLWPGRKAGPSPGRSSAASRPPSHSGAAARPDPDSLTARRVLSVGAGRRRRRAGGAVGRSLWPC